MSISTPPTSAPTSTTTVPLTLVEQIEVRQAELGITDTQLCEALGFEREIILQLIKQGTMKFPLNKVPALASALALDAGQVVKTAMKETSPDLLAVIESVFDPMKLTTTETNLIRHLRKLAGDQPCAPIVFEGKAVIALVTA